MGRTKQPTQLRILRGNPGKRPIPADEPKPPTDCITPPPFCTGAAAEMFAGYAEKLRSLGLMTNLDVDALGWYCVSMVIFQRELEICQRGGVLNIVKDEQGRVRLTQTSGSFTAMNKMMEKMMRIGQQFGMTPSSRAGLATPNGKPNDPLASWLQKHA